MRDPSPPEFEAALEATATRRGTFGDPLHYFDEIGSTNDEALRLAEAGASEGTTVVAAAQTAGRGRLGRSWYSPPGAGLYASVVIRDARVAPLITLAVGVAIAEGIRAAASLPVEIKWPNDIVVETGLGKRRKLAGILTEASTSPDGMPFVVVGFGVNLLPAAYPSQLGDRATSIAAELGRSVDAALLLAECLAAIAVRVKQLRSGNTVVVLERWVELSPTALGVRVECDGPRGPIGGLTAGIDRDGALLVRAGADVAAIRSGVVRWL